MNSEILYIAKRLGFPSSFGMRSGLGDFLEQYPDGIYAETGIGAPIGWESAAVWFGGESERVAARFERMVAERNDVSRLFRTRVSGVLLLTFLYRLKKRAVTAVPVGGGTPPTPPIDEWWGLKLMMPEGGTVILRKNGNPNSVILEVSTDAVNWQPWELVGTDYSYTLAAGQTLCIRNTSETFVRLSNGTTSYYRFVFNNKVDASGSVMSLSVNDETVLSLVGAAFNFCNLFNGCTSLMTAPYLTATTLSQRCYNALFRGCSMLSEIRTNMTDISASDCLTNWLDGVSAQGDFYCHAELTIPTGVSGIPSGWTRHDI